VNRGYIYVRGLLEPKDTTRILQLLHFEIRKQEQKRVKTRPLQHATDSFAAHLQDKTLAPHPNASIHLLSIYKETRQFDKGKQLWSWLIRQDDEYVDPGVYGAAIELLAYDGESLERSEELYQQALKRFPDNFIEYHLSPVAIVPDRGQAMVLPIPMTLLQGILTARVLAGDWRNAYLTFDTALRLIPDLVPARFFDVLINERPVSEAVRIFHLACHAKVLLSTTTLTTLISRIRTAADEKAPVGSDVLVEDSASLASLISRVGIAANEKKPDHSSDKLAENLKLAVTACDLIRAQAGAGGRLAAQNLSSIITKCLSPLITWSPDLRPISEVQASFNHSVTLFAREMLDLFLAMDAPYAVSAYNSLITLAGNAKDAETVIDAIKRVSETQKGPDDITCRAFLVAAAMCGNPEGLWQNAWRTLVAHTEEQRQKLDEVQWKVLGRSVSYINDSDARTYVEKEMEKYKPTETLKQVVRRLAMSTPHTINPMRAEDVDFERLSEHLRRVQQVTKDQMLEFDAEALLTPLRYTPTLGSIEDLRKIYDELTTDPSQTSSVDSNTEQPTIDGKAGLPDPVEASAIVLDAGSDRDTDTDQEQTSSSPRTVAIGASGMPFDENRFLNWMAVNELLVMAERHHKRHGTYVDKEIRDTIITSRGPEGPDTDIRPLQWLEPAENHILADEAVRHGVEGGKMPYDVLRALILRVRGRE
jgi:tetratricopeptide (TPR) repeat protein